MKKCFYLLLALLAFTATAWAQNSKNVGSESDLRNYLTNQQYDNYTFNLTDNITIPSANGEIEVRYRAIINMNGKTIMAENPTIRIFHVVSQGSLPYMPSLTLTGNGTLNGGGNGGTLDGGAIYNEGMLTLQNVTLQNATATNGGAVYNTGTMTMSGGSITGCTASNKGGGIYNTGTLTISDGSVSSNEAGNAGGIHLVDQCTFNLTGGSISGNRAIQSGNANKNCGGVNITGNSTMNMSGGSIADNTAS